MTQAPHPQREQRGARVKLGGSVLALLQLQNKRQIRARLNQVSGRLQALSPLAILERGYALVFDAAGNLVKDAEQVKPGEEIRARLARGTVAARVERGNL